jgi:hypothetical protein
VSRRNPQAGAVQHLADQRFETAPVVAIAGQGGPEAGTLHGLAQPGPWRQVAGLEHNHAVAGQLGEEVIEDLAHGIAGLAQPDGAPAAGHRDGRSLVGQAGGVLGDFVGGEIGDAKGITKISGDAGHQGFDPLAHQARVRPVDEHRANLRVRVVQELFDAFAGELHGAAAPVTA